MNRPPTVRRSVTVPSAGASMRILEYGVGFVAATAALLLGLVR